MHITTLAHHGAIYLGNQVTYRRRQRRPSRVSKEAEEDVVSGCQRTGGCGGDGHGIFAETGWCASGQM